MIVVFADKGASQNDDQCLETRCRENGPPIRFPFRLKGRQPPHCGYPGFDLSCITSNKTTVLELPNIGLKLFVGSIYYESQEIIAYNPFSIQKHNLKIFNLSIAPFQFPSHMIGSTLFKCSLNRTDRFYFGYPNPCLSDPRSYYVYVSFSDYYMNFFWSNFVSCANLSVPPEIFQSEDYTVLTWSEPNCAFCEAKGKMCRLKRPTATNETECLMLSQPGKGGLLPNSLVTAGLTTVKILNNSKGQGEEIINEVATIGQIHHVNVVSLVGYCAEGFRRALIYEFLPNASLEKYISSQPSGAANSCSLSWEILQDIAKGTAKGIEYLHQGCNKQILHFDIKPRNILLDHNFKPKISDFGLAKLCF
ncbi:Mitogen-activated protein kinase kinase kinase [Parasponia andersonii]|uniref:Mitogen-activated protein kinase kinase kinase n=1 Tax=Parasponia andersonii TaxID=3476 RepID=A0A2P5ASA1_PARAD|nr:Mitogen-activated protein kinase kinase kinase [Parasponia andersonii]